MAEFNFESSLGSLWMLLSCCKNGDVANQFDPCGLLVSDERVELEAESLSCSME
jgi:hypothetical protein